MELAERIKQLDGQLARDSDGLVTVVLPVVVKIDGHELSVETHHRVASVSDLFDDRKGNKIMMDAYRSAERQLNDALWITGSLNIFFRAGIWLRHEENTSL